jgi:hypothetical protein
VHPGTSRSERVPRSPTVWRSGVRVLTTLGSRGSRGQRGSRTAEWGPNEGVNTTKGKGAGRYAYVAGWLLNVEVIEARRSIRRLRTGPPLGGEEMRIGSRG